MWSVSTQDLYKTKAFNICYLYTPKTKMSNQSTTIDKERTNALRPGVATRLLLLGHQYIANGNDWHNQQ